MKLFWKILFEIYSIFIIINFPCRYTTYIKRCFIFGNNQLFYPCLMINSKVLLSG